MFVTSAARPAALSLALWLEAAALFVLAISTRTLWLLPVAGFLMLAAGITTRKLWLGIPTALATAGWWLWHILANAQHSDGALTSAHPIGALLVGAALAFLNILSGLRHPGSPDVSGCLARMVVFVHFLTAGVLLGGLYSGGAWQRWLGVAFAILSLVLAVDCLMRLVSRLYTPRRHWDVLPAPGAFFFYRWLGPDWRACLPAETERDETFDLKLAEMWMWPTVRAALPALVAVTALLVWLTTCLHEVPVGASGVRQCLGIWQTESLPPGLHVSLPWPLGGIKSVDTARLREVVLGFRTDPGRPILWERAHYEDEQNSLVGGGDDFLSISVPVLYRVSDPVLHLRSSTNTEALLRSLAGRVLLDLTIRRPAREIMTTAREELRHALRAGLQTALDQARSGLTLAGVSLRDIHPPVTVAPAFQEVVSALEEKEAFHHEGDSYHRDNTIRAQGDANAVRVTADSTAANRLLQARGQAARFNAQREAWAAAPTLYQWREGFRVLDDTLGGAKKAVFDESLRSGMPVHVDLRKVLNPDFVSTAPPRPQTLVPRPSKSQDAFDLDIEGYLRADKGDIPAVNVMPEDKDNLLKPEAAKP